MKPFSTMLTTTWQGDLPSRTIGRWEPRKRAKYIKPQGTPHAWNNTLKGGDATETNPNTGLAETRGPHAAPADRFSTAPGNLRHLVKDGAPLTDRGAELLERTPVTSVLSASTLERGLIPQVVDSKPPHSQAKNPVHSYQQTKRK